MTDAVGPGRQRRNVAVRAAAGTGHAIAAGWHRLAAWNAGRGAAASGLARLVEAHALQAAGDATITVALAGSLFFSVPTAQARTHVALYLLVTMAPFAVVAPVLGPLLDRFRHGRRFALAATMVVRATLGLVIGHSLASHSGRAALELYPAALGVLVCMKTYAIARSAAVPRVLPPEMTLVQANSRLTLAGVVMPGIAGAVAVGVAAAFGRMNALRLGAVVYAIAAVLALRLPRKVDGGRETRAAEERPARAGLARLGQVDAHVAAALRSAATLRWLAGFLLLFGAFVVKAHPVLGGPNRSLAGLAVGIGVGNALGVVVGARAPVRAVARLDAVLLGVTAAATLLTAIRYSLLTVFALAVVSSATAAIVKLGLDATIQDRVDDAVRTSTFARSETTLQLAWVVGGGVGIALPASPTAGFAVATAVLAGALAVAARSAHRHARGAAA